MYSIPYSYDAVLILLMQSWRRGMADKVDDAGDVVYQRRGVRATRTTHSRLLGVRMSASRHQHQRTTLRDAAQDTIQVSGHSARRRKETATLLGRTPPRDLHRSASSNVPGENRCNDIVKLMSHTCRNPSNVFGNRTITRAQKWAFSMYLPSSHLLWNVKQMAWNKPRALRFISVAMFVDNDCNVKRTRGYRVVRRLRKKYPYF